jgi:hypothetical protein
MRGGCSVDGVVDGSEEERKAFDLIAKVMSLKT